MKARRTEREVGQRRGLGEFVPALVDMAAEVSAVLALAGDVLVAFEARLEGWRRVVSTQLGRGPREPARRKLSRRAGALLTVVAASEEEEHVGGRMSGVTGR